MTSGKNSNTSITPALSHKVFSSVSQSVTVLLSETVSPSNFILFEPESSFLGIKGIEELLRLYPRLRGHSFSFY